MNKAAILEKIIEEQQKIVDSMVTSREEYREESDLDENSGTIDPEDLSNQTNAKEMEMRMQVMLDNAKAELEKLKQYSGVEKNEVAAGALVDTGERLFFVGSGIASMQVFGKELLGVSLEAPAFRVMAGKKAGDSFTLGNETYSILSVQ
ncbi:MAG TPA: hypothetical protein PKY29_02710 [Ferruginibacter sp.]|mgnify:CR=1 FL=1|nr:hypothetical protein [Ferruginibacter sp.]HRO16822.1 hypothetical protein [Ferruginibacter sp.]HRQ20194.1 hypothetical protein [Ferruginibacter sp.]